MRQTRIIQAMTALLVVAFAAVTASAAGAHRIGRASGSMGAATIDGQKITVNSPVFEGSQIVTGATDSASVLLDSNVVLKFDGNTSAIITEARGTHVSLQHGNVEVFLAKRGPMQGAVALSDPDAQIEALGTVFIAGYSPATRDGWYGCVESARPRGISVKGTGDVNASDVVPGKHATLHAGKLQNIANNTANDLKARAGRIVDLDAQLNRQAGTFSRQQTALAAAGQLATRSGRQISYLVAGEVADESQNRALTDAVQFQSVNNLVFGGLINSGANGGGGGTGGNKASSGGFTDASVLLDTGDILNFRLVDTGLQDGDQVAVKIIDNGKTVASIPMVTLTNAGQLFSQKVNPGTVNISLTATSEGSVPPNTGGVNLLNSVQSGQASQSYSINKGQTATLRVKVK